MSFDSPLSLYVHIPWCVQKCPYCDFNSYALDKNAQPENQYVQALIDDLKIEAERAQGRALRSIFIGGGTPSLFSPKSIELLLNAAHKLFILDENIEITLEANPGTFEYQKFADFVSAGVNRISLGVQSFDDHQLKALGRIHQSGEAKRAIEALHKIPLRSFNIDIMYALPNQTVEQALTDLQTAMHFEPKHFSWYHLTLEPNTVFYRNPPNNMPDEDRVIEIETSGRALLAENHLHRYEVSAYSLEHHQSIHNKNYWTFGDYLGIGAGAHGKITDLTTGIITRTTKQRVPKNYLNPDLPFTSSERVLSSDELPLEFMMNALRLTEGISLDYFTQRTGLSLDVLSPMLEKAIQKELVFITKNILKPTPLGAQFLNDLVGMFS
jgi:putative oxygen-independent coproporphyrinogen III oxidase